MNALVSIRGEDGEFRSRVEDAFDDSLVLARPLDLPLEHNFVTGCRLQVTWSADRGINVLPAVLSGSRVEGGIALWTAKITGAGWTEQRRDYVRVPISGPVEFRLIADKSKNPNGPAAEPAAINARLVELSEATLVCVLSVEEAEELTTPGSQFVAHMQFGARTFDVVGRSLRVIPNEKMPELCEVVFMFDKPVRQADDLRRVVFAEQLRSRR